MIWVLILTIAVLLIAFETACLLLIVRNEYAAIAGILRNGNKRIERNGLVDQSPFERRNELMYQSEPNFDGDDFC